MSYYLGLMIGSSADSVDVAIIDITQDKASLITFYSAPLPKTLQQQLLSLTPNLKMSILAYRTIEFDLSKVFLKAVKCILQKANINLKKIKGLGVHGYTCLHQPNNQALPLSLQMINAGFLAQELKLLVVTDFRSMDVFAKGQGAPFAPAFHHFLWAKQQPNIAIVNIGGMANITAWQNNKLIGFDTGPGNVWLDSWVRFNNGQDFDRNGQWASLGKVEVALLKQLMQHEFFQQTPPKSTSRDDFNLASLKAELAKANENYAPINVQATLAELTAFSIASALKQFVPWHCEVYLCGGGVYNLDLVTRLKHYLKAPVYSSEKLGWSPDCIEAAAFAWLAWQRLEGKKAEIASVTGAKHNSLLGSVYAGAV